MRTIAVIQARMGSTRLPGKVLRSLGGRPALAWVVERARRIEGVDGTVVATSTDAADDRIAAWCAENGVPVHRGSEADVLDRYVTAARQEGADAVVRITGDCPLLDPAESARVVRLFESTPGCDYASNLDPPFLPDGLDTEVVRASVLERLAREVHDPASREHVTHFIRIHPERFRTAAVDDPRDLSDVRLTLDEPEDLASLSAIGRILAERRQQGSLDEVLAILAEHPDLARRRQRAAPEAAER